MAVYSSNLKLLLLLLLVVVAILCAAHAAPFHQPNPNCPKTCGSVAIPFPFGIGKGCALDSSFLIDCNQTSSNSNSTLPRLSQTGMSVLNISLNGELRVSWPVVSGCLVDDGTTSIAIGFEMPNNFGVSWTRNKFTAVGCNTLAIAQATNSTGKSYASWCLAVCFEEDDGNFGADKSSYGFCTASIPAQARGYFYYGYSVPNITSNLFINNVTRGSKQCSHAFVVEDGKYQFKRNDLEKLEETTFPVVLDWTVGNHTCRQAKKNASSYACKANNSTCHDSTGLGYFCSCSTGFYGNPYLPYGCHDVNECTASHNCVKEATCHNTPGGYTCSCRKGYEGDGKSNGTRCSRKSKADNKLKIALIVSVSIVALLAGNIYAYWELKKRKLIKLKEQFFQQNGGLLLQQKIVKHKGSIETVKVFTMEELKKATNNFDEGNILGKGGQGIVYKGLLPDNKIVAIKRSKISNSSQIEQFINEVIVLSQINHRNVVKLLGCCLETEVPLLVYEFISNGTVSEHLHDYTQSLKLTWRTRLSLAVETAGALAYLHSATSIPIIHRDVKITNILLDCDLKAKVSDFGASKIVPLDKTQVTTLVQGTLGYLDPEYFHTSQLTEKSDVYSFGVVLAELLTGRNALSFDLTEDDRNLAAYFVFSMDEGHLLDIVDNHIVEEARAEVLIEFASVARQCLRLRRDERPTMKEVAMELERLRVEEKHRWEESEMSSKEINDFLRASSSVFNAEHGTSVHGIGSGFDTANLDSMSLVSGR